MWKGGQKKKSINGDDGPDLQINRLLGQYGGAYYYWLRSVMRLIASHILTLLHERFFAIIHNRFLAQPPLPDCIVPCCCCCRCRWRMPGIIPFLRQPLSSLCKHKKKGGGGWTVHPSSIHLVHTVAPLLEGRGRSSFLIIYSKQP